MQAAAAEAASAHSAPEPEAPPSNSGRGGFFGGWFGSGDKSKEVEAPSSGGGFEDSFTPAPQFR